MTTYVKLVKRGNKLKILSKLKMLFHLCTVPYPGVDKVKVKVNVGVKVNIRRRLGEATPSASIAKRKRRQGKASPR